MNQHITHAVFLSFCPFLPRYLFVRETRTAARLHCYSLYIVYTELVWRSFVLRLWSVEPFQICKKKNVRYNLDYLHIQKKQEDESEHHIETVMRFYSTSKLRSCSVLTLLSLICLLSWLEGDRGMMKCYTALLSLCVNGRKWTGRRSCWFGDCFKAVKKQDAASKHPMISV